MNKKILFLDTRFLFCVFIWLIAFLSNGQSTQTFNSSGTFIVPCGVTSITVQVWGGGGGGDRTQRRGGGGGAFAQSTLNVSEGNSFVVTIGQGGAAGTGDNGGDSTFDTLVIARGGNGGNGGSNAGRGGQGSLSTGDITFNGGNGGSSSGNGGAGGGAAAGRTSNGANGSNNNTGTGASGATGANGGGNGGNGGGNGGDGGEGAAPGGGGGERGRDGNNSGGGGNGRVEIIYNYYCAPTFNNDIEPITNVTFAGVNKTSTNTLNGTPALESFCDVATVTRGTTYPISIKGNTFGNYTTFITVYVDWNQNGVFENTPSERYDIGIIRNSNGDINSTPLEGNINVPIGALVGNTRMRVIKSFNNNSNSYVLPCSSNGWGQAEDYTVTVLPTCVLPGNTISSVSAVCANTPFTLSLQNTSASATAYQWQTSLDNVSWSNVPSVPFFNTDFESITANSDVYGPASVTGGELVLTTAVNSQTGGYVIQSTPGTNINSFTASFDYRMFGGNGADGVSLNYGSNIGNNQGGGEEGEGTGLILKFDSYDNTSNTTASQIRIFYGGVQIFSNTLNSFDLRNSLYRNVLLSVDGNGLLSLKIAATTIVSGLSLPAGYLSSNKSNWKFKFSARTGGLNDKHSIDNLRISYLNSVFTTSQTVPTYYRSIVTCGGTPNTSTPVFVTMDPKSPIVGTITPLTCAIPTGSIVLSDLTVSATLMQTGNVVKTYNITATTMTIDDLTPGDYYFAVKNGTCESVISPVVTIVDKSSTTWNGSGWLNGEPSITSRIIFAGNYDSTKDVIGCDCTVNSGVNVVFKYINPSLGHTLTVTNDVKILGSGKLTFENNASLVQTANSTTNINSGEITYQRRTSPYNPFDYIYWSSPVGGQILRDVSPQTPLDKFYSFDVATYDWKQENANLPMKNGVGYIIRGADYKLPTPPGLHQASFFGIPNNGLITVAIPSTAVNSESSALLGNPYPSALDANEFLKGNTSILEGTLYFWTHNTAIQNVGNITNGSQGSGVLVYTSDDYATYNLTGGVTVVSTGNIVAGTAQPGNKPSGKIASGQSFFAGINAVAGTVKFENSMRVGVGDLTGNNTQFFRTASGKSNGKSAYENHRVWLNLTNTQGAFKQLLVGYITGATNAYDPFFDGVSFNGNEFVDFYSITGDETLTIQGRALPFDENDMVSLGYSSTIEGEFSINIDEVDGIMQSQEVYLEDKMVGLVHDLKVSPYKFTTAIGTFDDRFVLRYTDKTLGVADLDQLEDRVIISKDKNELKIKSATETIKRVTIFDLLGKKVFDKEALDETEFRSSNVSLFKQMGIVKVTLANGQVISKKVAF